MEKCFSHTIWTLRIHSNALWFSQYTHHVQTMMNSILREFLYHAVEVYLDEILIYSKTMEEHEALVKLVLATLERHDLAVSFKKSMFHVNTVKFLGYIVGKSGVTMSEKKVESIINWKAPRSVKDIQMLLDFTNFYQQFIEHF